MGRLFKYPHAVLPGIKFGRLEVMGPPFRAKLSTIANWYCVVRCECRSDPFVICVASMTSGLTRSCGCLRREVTGERRRIHGGSGDLLYGIWYDMRRRCRDSRRKQWKDYGGRGIVVDPRWDTYAPFRDWSLANGYEEGLDIDRKDNDGPYSPENCRYVSRTVNMRNMRRNSILDAFGERKSSVEWSEDPRCCVGYSTLRRRIQMNWDHERAIMVPARIKIDHSLR